MKKRVLKSYTFLILASIGLLMMGCKGGDKAAKEAQNAAAMVQLTALIDSKNYRIEIDAVHPFNTAATTQVLNQLAPYTNGGSTSRINVQGRGHYLEVTQEKVMGSMPYFGQQLQGGGQFGKADIGVDMDGVADEYGVQLNEKKGRYKIEFRTDDSKNPGENYDVLITLFPNRRAEVQVTSSHRTNIRYTGSVEGVEDTSS